MSDARPIRVAFVTIVPSPYQSDLLRELARRPEARLRVFYLEAQSPKYPWPRRELAPFESILPGVWIGGPVNRTHVNWPLPDLSGFDAVVLNTYVSVTAQWLARRRLRHAPWMFWGERLRAQPSRPRRWLQDILLAPLARASGIAAIGQLAQRGYQERYPQKPVVNIPYHCALDGFLAAPASRKPGEVCFLYCGIMNRRKGVDLLLAAFDRLVQSGAPARLLLVGQQGELPELMAPLSPQARDRIRFEGFQAPDRLPEFFAQADVFVLPSRWDGWGVVVNQALGAGLAVVASDAAGAAHDLVEPGVNGLRVPAGDGLALHAAMDRLVRQPGLAADWGAASRRLAAQWTPARGAGRWIDALQQVCPSS